ncbi:MAG: hypothetical protein KGI54_11520 [Pseudomonadota bacterium]|nr:hypothetical protein [Pseudomonadota bacterium]
MQIQTLVGPQQSALGALQQNLRTGRQGDIIVSELHGRYYETTNSKASFSAANQAGQVTTVGLATTYTGLSLSNPVGSQVNLVINKVSASFPVAPAAAMVVGLMTGYNGTTNVTHTTPVTPKSQFIGTGPAPVALVDAAATLPTAPTLNTVFGFVGTAAVTAVNGVPGIYEDLEGSIIIPPGGYAAIYTSTASGAAGMFASMSWEEVAI